MQQNIFLKKQVTWQFLVTLHKRQLIWTIKSVSSVYDQCRDVGVNRLELEENCCHTVNRSCWITWSRSPNSCSAVVSLPLPHAWPRPKSINKAIWICTAAAATRPSSDWDISICKIGSVSYYLGAMCCDPEGERCLPPLLAHMYLTCR